MKFLGILDMNKTTITQDIGLSIILLNILGIKADVNISCPDCNSIPTNKSAPLQKYLYI